jgi:hypoxanthine phosphoribosyltransferase
LITLHDKTFVPFISETEINQAIKSLAEKISTDYKEETPIFLGVLNGAFMFLGELMKNYKGNCEVSFTKLASYHGTSTTGTMKNLIGLNENIEKRHIIIVEDIVDTGNTLDYLMNILNEKNPKSIKTATLFFKPEAYKKNIKIDYIGMEIPNKFIVGYGLDYDGLGRNLPEIYQLKS